MSIIKRKLDVLKHYDACYFFLENYGLAFLAEVYSVILTMIYDDIIRTTSGMMQRICFPPVSYNPEAPTFSKQPLASSRSTRFKPQD